VPKQVHTSVKHQHIHIHRDTQISPSFLIYHTHINNKQHTPFSFCFFSAAVLRCKSMKVLFILDMASSADNDVDDDVSVNRRFLFLLLFILLLLLTGATGCHRGGGFVCVGICMCVCACVCVCAACVRHGGTYGTRICGFLDEHCCIIARAFLRSVIIHL